jgi:outer membrane protein assembly factor BamB
LWSKLTPFASSPAIGWNGYIYIGGTSAYDFYCLDPNNGTLLWHYPMASNPIYSTATVGYDGSVYVSGYDGPFYCLNGTNGELKWSINLSLIYYDSAAIGPDGSLYISNYNNKTLYAFLGTAHLF